MGNNWQAWQTKKKDFAFLLAVFQGPDPCPPRPLPPQILFASSLGQVAVRVPRPGGQQSPLASAASPRGHCAVAEEPRLLPSAPSTRPWLFKCWPWRFVPGPFMCDVASPLCVSKGRGERVRQALVPGGMAGTWGSPSSSAAKVLVTMGKLCAS